MVYILHGQENEIDKMFSISESYLTPVGWRKTFQVKRALLLCCYCNATTKVDHI